ncbi:hypothetical protein PAPYR_8444 [Paratrimastix pyriformis]|uniref:Uncharacterized protein n=1 Tax=Paratrimastix pyriformis TaxID=342808 RepID=A0ABQ8UE15_9EUKA|nr:hypothetical protein PAPYR_8444 [Paratrimastix pyriformis]
MDQLLLFLVVTIIIVGVLILGGLIFLVILRMCILKKHRQSLPTNTEVAPAVGDFEMLTQLEDVLLQPDGDHSTHLYAVRPQRFTVWNHNWHSYADSNMFVDFDLETDDIKNKQHADLKIRVSKLRRHVSALSGGQAPVCDFCYAAPAVAQCSTCGAFCCSSVQCNDRSIARHMRPLSAHTASYRPLGQLPLSLVDRYVLPAEVNRDEDVANRAPVPATSAMRPMQQHSASAHLSDAVLAAARSLAPPPSPHASSSQLLRGDSHPSPPSARLRQVLPASTGLEPQGAPSPTLPTPIMITPSHVHASWAEPSTSPAPPDSSNAANPLGYVP